MSIPYRPHPASADMASGRGAAEGSTAPLPTETHHAGLRVPPPAGDGQDRRGPGANAKLSRADLAKVGQLRAEGEEEHKAGNHQASLDTLARAEKLPGIR
jgi:hypothetical protein